MFDTTNTGIINGWKSSDEGTTWEQVTTNVNVYGSSIPTNKAPNSGNGYGFSSAWG